MTASFVFNHQETVINDVQELPPFQAKADQAISTQIAKHLKQTLNNLGKGANVSLRLPSAIALADFYHCTPLDVLDGLFTLKNQLYEYAMPGLDGEITLLGPVAMPYGPAHSRMDVPVGPNAQAGRKPAD